MKRKVFFMITILAFSLSLTLNMYGTVLAASSSADFTDLEDLDEQTKKKFDAMIGTGVFDGLSENTFGLTEDMNRAQFAKVAALVLNLSVDKDITTSSFKDVRADDIANGYALPYIEAIMNAGITDGVGEGKFDPAGKVTKEQLATFMVRGIGKEEEVKASPTSSDSTVSDWAKGYVNLALDLKLLENNEDGTFGGKADANRELLVTSSFEAARMLEETKELEVHGAEFVAGNKLNLTLTVSIDVDSVDLSNILINGIALDPKLDSFEISDDKKTIIIKLREGFILDSSKAPVITVKGLTTLYGNEVKSDTSKPIPVVVTEAPVVPTPEATSTPISNTPTQPNVPNNPNQ